ncbi:MAG: hypothetical protein C0616_10065 [Desulfuromonas sp.]|nr:MAG: hypothetical protein C0616_10065 [Desulfuromonas sp.]
MVVHRTRNILLLIICLVLISAGTGFAAKVTASAERDRVVDGESFQLDLKVEGGAEGDANLEALEAEFEILGRSQSSQMKFVNGDFSRSFVLSLTLMPRNIGVRQVPSICFGQDCSQPLKITVLPAGSNTGNRGAQDDLLLEVEVEPETVYVQGQILLTVTLLSRIDLLQAGLSEPQVEGVETVVQRLGDDRQTQVMRNGFRYQGIERRYALFPQQSGALRIAPFQFDGQVADGRQRRFDLFPRGGRQVRRHSRPIDVRVDPAPDSAANRSWLPALELELADDWQGKTQEMTVGEPLTRTLSLRATGLPSAQLPQVDFDVPSQFKTYPDQPLRKDFSSDAGIVGSLEQKLALVPTHPGEYELPEIRIDWWDVSSRRWRTVTAASVSVEVRAVAETKPSSSEPVADEPVEFAEKSQVGETGTPQTMKPVTRDPGVWPWLTLLVGLGWLGTLFLLLKARRGNSPVEPSDDDAYVQEKQAYRDLQQVLKNGNPQRIRAALQKYIKTTTTGGENLSLEQFAARAGDPLRHELETLDASLYGKEKPVMDPRRLERAIEQWRTTGARERTRDELPGLYPPK